MDAAGPFFFMKRAPEPRPSWIRTCAIDHGAKGVIDFPVIDDVPSLLWVINLGCIDLNQWYATCDDVDRPDYLHFDLDPGEATFPQVRDAVLAAIAEAAPSATVRQCGRAGSWAARIADRKGLVLDLLSIAFRRRAARHGIATNTASRARSMLPPTDMLPLMSSSTARLIGESPE